MKSVLFVSEAGVSGATVAAALFNQLCEPGRARAVAAALFPEERVEATVIDVLHEAGVSLPTLPPPLLSAELAALSGQVALLKRRGAESEYLGWASFTWELPNLDGRHPAVVRLWRDELRTKVAGWLREAGLLRRAPLRRLG